jgi:hypothetical protein
MDESAVVVSFIPIVAIIGLWAYLIVRSVSRSKIRELQIRERIALIEKGHVPAPETDPRGFDKALATDVATVMEYRARHGSVRHRRAGTTLIGVGLGLWMMISFAGDAPQTGIGVGGFLVMIGLAFLVNGLFERDPEPAKSSTALGPPKAE